jgi:hypothetical protein
VKNSEFLEGFTNLRKIFILSRQSDYHNKRDILSEVPLPNGRELKFISIPLYFLIQKKVVFLDTNNITNGKFEKKKRRGRQVHP